MSRRTFTLKYGKGNVSFEIPAKLLLHELLGRNPPPAAEEFVELYWPQVCRKRKFDEYPISVMPVL